MRQGLITFKFDTTRELIEAEEALEECMREGQQGQFRFRKWKDVDYPLGIPFFRRRARDSLVSLEKREERQLDGNQTLMVVLLEELWSERWLSIYIVSNMDRNIWGTVLHHQNGAIFLEESKDGGTAHI